MAASIEQAIRQWLSDGLDQVVTDVFTYGGEFDGEGLTQVVNQFPAVWVMFAGIKDIVRHDVRDNRLRATGQFTALAEDCASSSGAGSCFGGLHRYDAGTYRLMQIVHYLLTNQSLGLRIDRLQPGVAKSPFSHRMEQDTVSVFALEFETYWFEDVLQDGDWSRPAVSSGQRTEVYTDVSGCRGCTEPEYPDFRGMSLGLRILPKSLDQPTDMMVTVETEVKP